VEERLQKILARAGFASRRGAEQLMLQGRVTCNGETVKELGTKADLEKDDLRVDGVRVKAPKSPVYLVLNKPKGVVSSRSDPERRPTVMDLVPSVAGLFPVGRLDVTTEGLILLTNDGAFAEKVAHPRYEVPRVYHAKVHRVPDAETLERLRRGVRVESDFMAVDRARVIDADNNAWVEVTLHEGKQHEVKRLLEAVGHPVSKLRRVAIGPVTSRGLEPGQFRALTPEEIQGLQRGQAAAGEALGRLARRRHRPRTHGRPGATKPSATKASATKPGATKPGATRSGAARPNAPRAERPRATGEARGDAHGSRREPRRSGPRRSGRR
jgi:23S rRNA pseudouridine2605 synthase